MVLTMQGYPLYIYYNYYTPDKNYACLIIAVPDPEGAIPVPDSNKEHCNCQTGWIGLGLTCAAVTVILGLVMLLNILLLIVLFTDPGPDGQVRCGQARRFIQRKIFGFFKLKVIK